MDSTITNPFEPVSARRFSQNDRAFHSMVTHSQEMDLDIVDGMRAAVEDTIRTLPIASVIRGVQSFLDDSEKMPAETANEMYGLTGEFAFPEGTEVTTEQAKAVSTDRFNILKNDMITDIVNEDSPVLGRLTQFAAAMGAGFADPVLIGLNIAGSMAIGKGASFLMRSSGAGAKMYSGINKISPATGRIISTMYDDAITKSLSTVIAREGLENFAGSVLEETINFVGIGEERLAKNITASESLMNIVIGTGLGGTLGTVISRDGRKAISRSFARKYGDDAAGILKSENIVTEMEANAGIPRSNIVAQMHDIEVFSAKPWHGEGYTFSPIDSFQGKKAYLPLNNDSSIHTISHMGRGVLLTDNHIQAQNLGVDFLEVDIQSGKYLSRQEQLNPDGTRTSLGQRLHSIVVDDILSKISSESLSKALAHMRDPDIDFSEFKFTHRNDKRTLARELRKATEGMDIHETVSFIEDLLAKTHTDYDTRFALDSVLNNMGYDGYIIRGKNLQGHEAFNGLYITESATDVLRNASRKTSTVPNPEQKTKWNEDVAAKFKEYDAHIKNQQKIQMQNDPVLKQDPDMPPVTTDEAKALVGTAERRQALESILADIEQKKLKGEPLAEDLELAEQLEESLNVAKALADGQTEEQVKQTAWEKLTDFFECVFTGGGEDGP